MITQECISVILGEVQIKCAIQLTRDCFIEFTVNGEHSREEHSEEE